MRSEQMDQTPCFHVEMKRPWVDPVPLSNVRRLVRHVHKSRRPPLVRSFILPPVATAPPPMATAPATPPVVAATNKRSRSSSATAVPIPIPLHLQPPVDGNAIQMNRALYGVPYNPFERRWTRKQHFGLPGVTHWSDDELLLWANYMLCEGFLAPIDSEHGASGFTRVSRWSPKDGERAGAPFARLDSDQLFCPNKGAPHSHRCMWLCVDLENRSAMVKCSSTHVWNGRCCSKASFRSPLWVLDSHLVQAEQQGPAVEPAATADVEKWLREEVY